MKYKLIKAGIHDGVKMLDLIECISSKGVLQLLYTRRPDAYLSYMKENKDSVLRIIKDEDGRVVFIITAIPQNYYYYNKKEPIYYAGGLRKHPDFKKKIHWMDMLYKLSIELPYDKFYCSILDDNKHAKDVLVRKKDNWLNFDKICSYETNIFTPKVFSNKYKNDKYILKKVTDIDIKELHKFINKERKRYDLFPVLDNLSDYYNIDTKDAYVLLDNNEIVAFTALWNQEEYKQYVVKKYGFPLNFLKTFSFITEKMGYIPFPNEDETFSFTFLSFFLVKDNNIDIYKVFLSLICKEVEKDIKSLVIGINDQNIQDNIFNKAKKISFKSTIYFIYYGKKIKEVKTSFIECGLL